MTGITPSSVSAAVIRDLEEIAKRDPALAESSLAMSAVRMAIGLDSNASLAQKTLAAKELREIMDRLREIAPADEEDDALDGLQADYTTRLRSVG